MWVQQRQLSKGKIHFGEMCNIEQKSLRKTDEPVLED